MNRQREAATRKSPPRSTSNLTPTTLAPRGDGSRSTGLQMAIASFDALLLTVRHLSSPREAAVFLEIARRRLELEREQHDFAIRRWAA